ncbi:hypothetical protein NKG95_17935 [Mesorhizobium sp. M1423]|uniref:hypothetical protein n=1 Tax=Mesorhizobium sp. M1423 TaxID=2957101 RepID=UPI0033396359
MRTGLKETGAIIFAAAILYAMQRTTPLYSNITSPVSIAGEQGERTDARAFALAVGDVHLARTVRIERFGQTRTYTTSGVWVLVEAAAEAKRESLTLTSAEWLGPSGLRYSLSQRISTMPAMLPAERLEPGLPKPVLMAFEVPENELAGGTVLVAPSAFTPLGEEVRVAITELAVGDIPGAVTIRRSDGPMPWTLETE